jgi:CheY-like chemotaxis protein
MVRRGAHLLVVDDDDAVRHGLALQLAAWGFTVDAASGAEAARALLPSGGLDGLIADFRLGGETTGIALARDLAARNRRPLAVLLLTGDTEPERLREASDSGFRLLHKPAGPDDLHRMLLGDPGEGAQGGDRHPFGLEDAGPPPPPEGETSSA